jgi:beta-1,4-mannosyl-glycoprotein beta-1,4-N-acetylglucosaminyltransferase
MKVYDCFTFFNELDLLEIRLNELNDVVDHFVIVEGENTFQGKSKPMYFLDNKERYEKFLSKIIHVRIPSEKLSSSNPWDNERTSFDSCLNGLLNADDEDIIIISTVDEIPSASSIRQSIEFGATCKIIHQFFYFYLNTKYWSYDTTRTTWNGSCVTKYITIKNKEIRDWFMSTRDHGFGINGGWHFSFLGDGKNAFEKVNSYSHNEYNHISEEFYQKNLEELKDPFSRNITGFHSFEDLNNLPKYVQENLNKFKKYIRD